MQVQTARTSSAEFIALLTVLSLLAFAGNSLLCRLALRQTDIDAGSFTLVRLFSGALMLWLILAVRGHVRVRAGNWGGAFALFVYAAAFSYAYIGLTTGIGALLLFGAVNATMTGFGLWKGERLQILQWTGIVASFAGLIGLNLPGLSAPPPGAALLMVIAGAAWGAYSLLGRGAVNPLAETAGNFIRTLPMALVLGALAWPWRQFDASGVALAVASGALTSGVGYAIWYRAQPHLRASTAATLQLSVPVIAALGGMLFLGESLSLRLMLASVAIIGGIALVIFGRRTAQ